MKPYWISGDRKIPYRKLADDHLKNIIKDWYRNPNLITECKRRGFNVPIRPVDSLTFSELNIWIESFTSCAIEGNLAAERMLRLYDNDKPMFFHCLNAWMVKSASCEL